MDPVSGESISRALGLRDLVLVVREIFINARRSNRYSAKLRFGLSRQSRFAGFGSCRCGVPRYEEMLIGRFGLIREGGYGTWHRRLGTAPHLEQCDMPEPN